MIDNKTIRKVIMLNKMLPGGSPTYENREASGAVANFTTNVVMPFVKCECTIDATESGTDELTLTRTGKNLNGFTLADFQGGIVVGNARFIGIKIPKSTITYSSNAPTGNIWVARDFIDITTANNRVFDGSPVTYDNVEWLCIGLQKDNMETAFEYLTQAELGNVATTYVPYTGSTYTVALDETAYGGSVDVIAGSGRIIDEHGNLVYTLFEPVSISALEGVNNVWCDTGDTKVTYKYKTGEGGSSTKKYLPIFYDFYGKEKYHDHS